MMHVDKNADGHVLDVNRISGEFSYVPLNGRIRSKQDMLTNGHDKMRISVMILNLDMLPRGSMDLKFGCASQRSDGSILDMLPRSPLKLNLDVLPRSPLKLNFGRAS